MKSSIKRTNVLASAVFLLILLYGTAFILVPGVLNIINRPAPFNGNQRRVSLECLEAPTDSDVVRAGRQAAELISMGFTPVLCGSEIDREEASMMASY